MSRSASAILVQGVLAGALGNAFFTAYQSLIGKGSGGSKPDRWSDAPAPAQVGKRVAEGVFDEKVTLDDADRVANIVHWIYGTSWGALYAVLEESVDNPLVSAVTLGSAVVVADYTILPLMKVYKPPWRYPTKTLAADYGHHLVYGLAVAGAYRALDAVCVRE